MTLAVPFTARPRRAFAAAAAMFAAALAACVALLGSIGDGTPPWWVALAIAAIAAIGVLRNVVALRRAHKVEQEAP